MVINRTIGPEYSEAIFTRENYTAQTMVDVSYISESLECVFVSANNNIGSFVIGCVYRPPKSNIDDFLLVKLEQILVYIRDNCKNDIVIHGDFNIDLKLRENSFADRFLILMSSFGLMPVILRPTRITVNTRSIIDNIFVSDTTMLRSSKVIKSKISDHFPIYIVSCFGKGDLGGSGDDFVVIEKRQLNENNVIGLKRAIEEHNWDQVKQCRAISDIYIIFSGELYALYNKCCPKVKHKIKKKYFDKPYINDELKTLIIEKKKIQRKYYKKNIATFFTKLFDKFITRLIIRL